MNLIKQPKGKRVSSTMLYTAKAQILFLRNLTIYCQQYGLALLEGAKEGVLKRLLANRRIRNRSIGTKFGRVIPLNLSRRVDYTRGLNYPLLRQKLESPDLNP